MKNFTKRSVAALCAVSALSLAACTPQITETYDSPRPWHDEGSAYEQLLYTVNVYDTAAGSNDDARVLIGLGSLSLTLEEDTRSGTGSATYSQFDMMFSLTYNNNAPEADRGKTDTITSSVEYLTDSLATTKMTKTVSLAPREGVTDMSYIVTADYTGTHTATRTMGGKTDTLDIPQAEYHDNEMMIFLARSTAIGNNKSTNFFMTNIFDSFEAGEVTSLTMTATGDKETRYADLGWIDPFVVIPQPAEGEEPVTYESGKLPCTSVAIMMSVEKHGPPYYVYYSEFAIKDNGSTHKKLPVRISYSEYSGSKQVRFTDYTLTTLSFTKPAQA